MAGAIETAGMREASGIFCMGTALYADTPDIAGTGVTGTAGALSISGTGVVGL